MISLDQWREAEARIDAYQIADGSPLLDRLAPEFVESLEPLEALALAHSPEAWLRPRQSLDSYGLDWLVAVLLCGRGWGKSTAAAGWLIQQILAGHHTRPQDFALVAPTLDECWSLQWEGAIQPLIPPWVRVTERVARNEILFPDHGVSLQLHSAEISEYRGPNLRGAWIEEPVKYPRGETLWRNLRFALRVPGVTPPRAVVTTTPPRELNWILDLCAAPDTIVVRGRMRDNPMIDRRTVAAAYRDYSGSLEGARELDGEVVLGIDRALFRLEELEAHRVSRAPALDSIVVACDPAQSSKRDADPVGIVVVGISRGHLYVLASCSEQLEPVDWARRAISWADTHRAGSYVVEPTGSGSYPRATLEAQTRILGASRRPIVDSPARGSKADRAAPLSAACASGRLHLVGRHPQLEKELTTWYPGANFSPGALDALVHGAAYLTRDWTEVL